MGRRQRRNETIRKEPPKPTENKVWSPRQYSSRFGEITVEQGEKMADVLLRIISVARGGVTISELQAAVVGLKPTWTDDLLRLRLREMVENRLLTTDYVKNSHGAKEASWSKHRGW